MYIPPLARHAVCSRTHECTGALLYGILVRMPVHKHVTFVVFNFLIAWDLPADPGIRIRKEESETTIRMSISTLQPYGRTKFSTRVF